MKKLYIIKCGSTFENPIGDFEDWIIENLENKDLYQLEMLKQELKNVQAQKEEVAQADTTEDYQKAADLKTKECKLIEEIDKINKKMNKN